MLGFVEEIDKARHRAQRAHARVVGQAHLAQRQEKFGSQEQHEQRCGVIEVALIDGKAQRNRAQGNATGRKKLQD